MLDPIKVAWFAQNKLFVIQGKNNLLQLFKIRSQSTAMNYCQCYLERGLRVLLRRYVVNRELLSACGFPLVHLKAESKDQIPSGPGDLA